VPEKDKKKIRDHIVAIHILKENDLKGSGVIGAYHARRVAPLMTRALPLYVMAPEASFDGTTLVEGTLPNSEIAQCMKEAMEPLRDDAGAALDFVYPVQGHPSMRPELDYVVFVSFPFSCLQLISRPHETNFERGETSHGTSSSRITRCRCRGIRS